MWAFGVVGRDAVEKECVDIADSLGSDIIRTLFGGGSNRWKRSVQEGEERIYVILCSLYFLASASTALDFEASLPARSSSLANPSSFARGSSWNAMYYSLVEERSVITEELMLSSSSFGP